MSVLEENVIQVGTRKFTYLRPSKSRDIPLKAMSNRGYMVSLKAKHRFNQINILEYESQLEHDYLLILDQDPRCLDIQTQPVEITYSTVKGKEATIVPDTWAFFDTGDEYLIEIKLESQLRKLIQGPNWTRRVEAIQEFCKNRNWKYLVITDRKIRCVRLNNIKNFLMAAKHFSPSALDLDLKQFNTAIAEILRLSPREFSQVVTHLSTILPMDRSLIISLLKHKLYFQVENGVHLDWNQPFEQSLLTLQENLPVPAWNLPENPNMDYSSPRPGFVDLVNEGTVKIQDKEREEIDNRFQVIQPIVNVHGKGATFTQIEEYCNNLGISHWPVYKTYLKYRKHGMAGLAPKRVTRHEKSHLGPRVDTLMNEFVEVYKNGEWRQIKGAYQAFRAECLELNLKPASYETFRRRVKKLHAAEKRGKFKPRSQVFIKRTLTSTYQEGRHPGCIVKMDHSLLDIQLVDMFTKQPIGRPWLTLGIDENTGGVWGFYLSFDPPSQESVTRAVLNGLRDKETTKDWKLFTARLEMEGISRNDHSFTYPIGGFPARIQVDNGMDFRAGSVRNFCMEYNITLEFRPIKTPEYGASVEKTWDIINSAIKNDLLGGRVYSLPKSRQPVSKPKFNTPPGHDSKAGAVHTFDSFNEWLFSFIVMMFNSRPRASNSLSPVERWNAGLIGANQHSTGGAVRYLSPANYGRAEFHSKLTVTRELSPQGFRYKNVFYTASWMKKLRDERVLVDGRKYELKISHQDIRYAFLIDPSTNTIRTLEAYKYDGDPEVSMFLKKGLGIEPGFEPETISLTTLNEFKKGMGSSMIDQDAISRIRSKSVANIKSRGKENRQERLRIEKISRSEEGKRKLEDAKKLVRLDENSLPPRESGFDPENFARPPLVGQTRDSGDRKNKMMGASLDAIFLDDGEEEIEAYPTNWNLVRDRMDFVSKTEEERK